MTHQDAVFAANTLTLVGDPDQLMYRFTGAAPEVMTQEVDKYIHGIETHMLTTNYRSTRTIISACSALIAHNYADKGGPYPQHFMKATEARPDAPEGDKIQFQMLPDVNKEAQAVVDTITEQMVNHGYEYGDFYVASRTRAQLAYLEGPLFRAGIKFINLAGGSFWDGYHIKNIVGYLELAYDQSAHHAFQAVYNIASSYHTDRKGEYCHHRWLGREFLNLTKGEYGNMGRAVAHNRRYTDGVEDLIAFVNDIKAELAYAETADTVLRFILDNCYHDWLKAKGEAKLDQDDGVSSLDDDIAAMLDIASNYSVEEFLRYVTDVREAMRVAKELNDYSDYTVIATSHRLKGSERKVMIGIGWGEGYQLQGLQNVECGLLPITWSLRPMPSWGVLPTSGMGLVTDERCIAFVIISRAKEKVFLFSPARYRDMNLSPSRFVAELGEYVEIVKPAVVVDEQVEVES